MTGSAVERLVPEPLERNLSAIEREQLDAQRVGAAAAMAFGSGALMVREDLGGGPWGIHAGGLGNWARAEGGTSLQRQFRRERCAEKLAHCAGAGLLLLQWRWRILSPAAGDVRAAARRPGHLFVGACGQSADQRSCPARARVPAA